MHVIVYARVYRSYALLIAVLGIDRKPSLWDFLLHQTAAYMTYTGGLSVVLTPDTYPGDMCSALLPWRARLSERPLQPAGH